MNKDEQSVASDVPEGRSALSRVRKAAEELGALRREAVKPGSKPRTDREIRNAIEQGGR